MSKKRKVWSIILMVIGGLSVIGSLGNLKEYWISLIFGLVLVGLGVWLIVSGKKKVQAEAQAKADKLQAKAEAAIAEAKTVSADSEKHELSCRLTYTDRFQERIAKQYKKEMSSDDYSPLYEVKPYTSYDGHSIRYNVLVDDDKIGELPASMFEKIGQVIDIRPRTVNVSFIQTQTEKGAWYEADLKYTYWV